MNILSINDNPAMAISHATKLLREGELIIFPTETCYGLGVDATNSAAVTKLLTYKGDRHRQVSIAVSSVKMAKEYVTLNEIARNIYREFLPGPLTVISSSLGMTDPRLESDHNTLGIRIPNHKFALNLIRSYGSPITATSANTSGKKEPYSLADWQKYTSESKKNMIALFLDTGKLEERPTSTVIDTTLNEPEVLRQGELILPASSPVLISLSPQETQNIAAKLITKYLNLLHKYPLIIALQGDLGTGKTQFAKGVATTLNLTENISSPTYTILKEYPYLTTKHKGTFYHLDTWRLHNMDELESTLKLSELLKKGNIACIEWAGKAKSHLEIYKEHYPILLVDIKDKSKNSRIITYSISTPEWS